MKRTTISRSSALLAGLTALAATGLAAQQPPAIQRPIDQARRAADQTSANVNAQQVVPEAQASGRVQIQQGPAGGMPNVQAPATHTVQQGETLWQLAGQFLGDPLLWPEIYRLNTNVIEDPHWIYPGEELRIAPGAGEEPAPAVVTEAVTVQPGAEAAAPAAQQQPAPVVATTGPTIFSQVSAIRGSAIELRDTRNYRAVREGEYYSSGFLTEGQPLPAGVLNGNLHLAMLGNIRTRSSTMYYEDIVLTPPAGETWAAGDMLLIYRRGDEVLAHGEMIIPTGMARVKGMANDLRVRATLVRQFRQVADFQEAIKVAPFVFNTNAHPEVVTNGITGAVLRLRDDQMMASLQDVAFIDKGADDGVRLGDVFQVYNPIRDPQGTIIEQDQARALVVNTRARTATVVLIELYRGDIGSNSLIRQVRRMPS